jgi:hypothetical protein
MTIGAGSMRRKVTKTMTTLFDLPKFARDYVTREFSSGPYMGPDGEQWIKDSRKWARNFVARVGGYPPSFTFHKNHYCWSAFFRIGEQWWYISCGDVRFKLTDSLLVRRCKGPTDYTGERNQYARFRANFEDELCSILGV